MTESASYEQRRERAADTFTVFVPEAAPERVAAALARRLGPLGYAGLPRAIDAMRTAREALGHS